MGLLVLDGWDVAQAAVEPDVQQSAGPVLRERGGTGSRLLRFALATITRRPERFVLSTLGIALAIMAVTVVRTISTGFGESGAASLDTVLDGDTLWVVPAAGVDHDPLLEAFLAAGPPSQLHLPQGWTARQTLTGTWQSPTGTFAVYGRDRAAEGTASVGAAAAQTLGVADGDPLTVAGHRLSVQVHGPGRALAVGAVLALTRVGGPAAAGTTAAGIITAGVLVAVALSGAAALLTSALPAWRAASQPPIRSLSSTT